MGRWKLPHVAHYILWGGGGGIRYLWPCPKRALLVGFHFIHGPVVSFFFLFSKKVGRVRQREAFGSATKERNLVPH